jgi:hypothetical protein
VSCSTISEIGSPASTCVTQEQTVASSNETYQSSPETSLQFPARLELPIGRIRPLQEALDAVMRASRKMIVPRPSDTELSRVYKELMRVTVYPRRCWSRRSMFPIFVSPGHLLWLGNRHTRSVQLAWFQCQLYSNNQDRSQVRLSSTRAPRGLDPRVYCSDSIREEQLCAVLLPSRRTSGYQELSVSFRLRNAMIYDSGSKRGYMGF